MKARNKTKQGQNRMFAKDEFLVVKIIDSN